MTPHPLSQTLQRLIEDVEATLRSKTSLDELVEQACVSKYHLHRVFRRVTGYSLMDYVRSRKLAASLDDLLRTGLRVADIAQEFGFDHHQSYIRAFRKEFGMTPAEFRRGRSTVAIVDKLDPAEWGKVGEGVVIKPSIVIKPAFRLVGIRSWIVEEENTRSQTANIAGVDFFYHERHRVLHAVNPDVYIGLTRLPDEGAIGSFYMPSLEVSRVDEIPNGMEADFVSAQKYAVFKYIGLHGPEKVSSATLRDIWRYIFQVWMPQMDLGQGERMSFERIDASLADEHYCEVELFYPLQRI
ncbi:AraC family transcriptional regulator [Gorillibacterium timonense]|uniref:AraC family transcriptional regulator n=1 Tax=Gorillibacterium timonense TaxID=1689269 RepID=UPI00071E1557|nr:helix-turn-helix domain-containing protein [Gorillibacterium timonense]